MRLKSLLIALTTFSLVSAPNMALAQVDPYAGRASEALASANRAPAPTRDANDLQQRRGYRGGYLIPAFSLIAIGLGLWAAFSSNENRPSSP